jgi:beta-galactosidase/beta-glucuronidase
MEQTVRDFQQITELGANVLRVYYAPPKWFLDLALSHGLRVLVDVPWNKHLCFLDAEDTRNEAIEAVRKAALSCAGHAAIFAISVVNEIPPDIVRWSGGAAVAKFIEELVDVVSARSAIIRPPNISSRATSISFASMFTCIRRSRSKII